MDNQRENLCECGHWDHADPPGSPWSHVRFHYGQLLGVEDFNQEQSALIHGKRIRNALLHGAGTVWGLKVKQAERLRGVLAVEPGLAIDALGREIYLPQEFCLDVNRIADSELWGELEEKNISPPLARTAFVTIRFQQCLSHRVPAIRPPCTQDSQTAQYARINGSFHISLEKAPPPDPLSFQRQWLSPATPENPPGWPSLRQRLVDFITGDTPVALKDFWEKLDEAPLVLAQVDFLVSRGKLVQIGIDNNIRAILPSVQLVAEQLLGQRLVGMDDRQALKVFAVNAEYRANDDKMAIHIDFNHPVAEQTIGPETVRVHTWQAGNPWQDVTYTQPPVFDNNRVTMTLTPNGAWQDGTTYQVILNGGDDQPIVSNSGLPLTGWWNEPINTQGQGQNVNVVRQWHLPQV